jgi:hypothetical protein
VCARSARVWFPVARQDGGAFECSVLYGIPGKRHAVTAHSRSLFTDCAHKFERK